MQNELLMRLVELTDTRGTRLSEWRDLDPLTCLWCGSDNTEPREIRIRGRLRINDGRWYDIHLSGFPGYATLICTTCLGRLIERMVGFEGTK